MLLVKLCHHEAYMNSEVVFMLFKFILLQLRLHKLAAKSFLPTRNALVRALFSMFQKIEVNLFLTSLRKVVVYGCILLDDFSDPFVGWF